MGSHRRRRIQGKRSLNHSTRKIDAKNRSSLPNSERSINRLSISQSRPSGSKLLKSDIHDDSRLTNQSLTLSKRSTCFPQDVSLTVKDNQHFLQSDSIPRNTFQERTRASNTRILNNDENIQLERRTFDKWQSNKTNKVQRGKACRCVAGCSPITFLALSLLLAFFLAGISALTIALTMQNPKTTLRTTSTSTTSVTTVTTSTATTTTISTSTSSTSTTTTSSTSSTTSTTSTATTSTSTSTTTVTTVSTTTSTTSTTSTTTTTTPPSIICTSTGVILSNEQFIYSPSQRYAAGMRNNRFAIYNAHSNANVTSTFIWTASQSSFSTPAHLALQGDRNIVVYSTPANAVLWSANTWNSGAGSPFCLEILNSGNLVWKNSTGGIIWQSNSAVPG